MNGIFSLAFLQFVIAFLSFFSFVLTSAIVLILTERKVQAWMQARVGPIHTGPWGLLQTVADVGKLILKEEIHATETDKAISILAQSVFLAPVIGCNGSLVHPFENQRGKNCVKHLVHYVKKEEKI